MHFGGWRPSLSQHPLSCTRHLLGTAAAQLLSLALGLLLVHRMQTAYERFWEARTSFQCAASARPCLHTPQHWENVDQITGVAAQHVRLHFSLPLRAGFLSARSPVLPAQSAPLPFLSTGLRWTICAASRADRSSGATTARRATALGSLRTRLHSLRARGSTSRLGAVKRRTAERIAYLTPRWLMILSYRFRGHHDAEGRSCLAGATSQIWL